MGRGVDRAGNHAVGIVLLDHHGGKVGGVGHGVARLFRGNALLFAQFVVGIGVVFKQLGFHRINESGLGNVQAKGAGLGADFFHIAQQDDFGHVAAQEDIRCAQDAFFGAFGQHNTHLVGLGALDQLEFKHHGRDAAAALAADAVFDFLAVDVLFKQAQHAVDLAQVARFDGGDDALQGHKGLVGVVRGHEDGQGGTSPALDKFAHLIRGTDTAGKQHTRDVGGGGRQARGNGGQQHVGAVAGGDDKLVLGNVSQHVVHMHGRDQVVAHQRIKAFFAKQHFCVQTFFHVSHGGLADGGVVGHRENKGAVFLRAEVAAQFVQLCLREVAAVHNGGNHIQSVGLKAVHGDLERIANILGAHIVAAGDQQNRAAQVGGNFGIELEFKNRVFSKKIGANAQNEIIGFQQLFVLLDDVFDKQVARTLVDDLTGLVLGVGKGVSVVHVELEVFKHQMDVGVAVVPQGFVDDGTEKSHLAHAAGEQLHGPKGNGALARHGPGGGDV